MNANELSVGNFVEFRYGDKGVYVKVVKIDYTENIVVGESSDGSRYSASFDNVFPILISGKTLLKNDFCYQESTGCYYCFPDYNYDKCTLEFSIFNVDSETRNNQVHIEEGYVGDGGKMGSSTMLHLMECNFIHQLQNIFVVCDIDKQITEL